MPSSKFIEEGHVRAWRNSISGPVVAVNGCFDIIHVGHVRLLRKAAEMGTVIVGVNSDESVMELKGPSRPINRQRERMEVLEALESVSAVTLFTGLRATNFLLQCLPDIWVKGSDYNRDTVNQQELAAVENMFGRVVFVDLVPGRSTTRIISALTDAVPSGTETVNENCPFSARLPRVGAD